MLRVSNKWWIYETCDATRTDGRTDTLMLRQIHRYIYSCELLCKSAYRDKRQTKNILNFSYIHKRFVRPPRINCAACRPPRRRTEPLRTTMIDGTLNNIIYWWYLSVCVLEMKICCAFCSLVWAEHYLSFLSLRAEYALYVYAIRLPYA